MVAMPGVMEDPGMTGFGAEVEAEAGAERIISVDQNCPHKS